MDETRNLNCVLGEVQETPIRVARFEPLQADSNRSRRLGMFAGVWMDVYGDARASIPFVEQILNNSVC